MMSGVVCAHYQRHAKRDHGEVPPRYSDTQGDARLGTYSLKGSWSLSYPVFNHMTHNVPCARKVVRIGTVARFEPGPFTLQGSENVVKPSIRVVVAYHVCEAL